MSELKNCESCGKVFLTTFKIICNDCEVNLAIDVNSINDYLLINKKATIEEVSENTYISAKEITKLIRDGKVSTSDAPSLLYFCQYCDNKINRHTICRNCRIRLTARLLELNNESQLTYNVHKIKR